MSLIVNHIIQSFKVIVIYELLNRIRLFNDHVFKCTTNIILNITAIYVNDILEIGDEYKFIYSLQT